MAQIGPKGRSRAPGGSAHLFVSLIRKSRRFYITYQKMKEIGPIPRYVHFLGPDILLGTVLGLLGEISAHFKSKISKKKLISKFYVALLCTYSQKAMPIKDNIS